MGPFSSWYLARGLIVERVDIGVALSVAFKTLFIMT